MNRQEKYDKLCEFIESISGAVKLKESGVYLNCLKGRLNKNYAHPEMAVCLEDIQAAIADGAYTYQTKNGKTWLPVRLQVWGKEAEKKQVEEVENSQPFSDFPSEEIPF